MNNWKQMSNQDQSEWLAGFCGWEPVLADDDCGFDLWHSPNCEPGMTTVNMVEHFNSPAGFMAVWDCLPIGQNPIFFRVLKQPFRNDLPEVDRFEMGCELWKDWEYVEEGFISRGVGNSRQEAFYEAVYKAVKDESS
jgi:hypothetical protein